MSSHPGRLLSRLPGDLYSQNFVLPYLLLVDFYLNLVRKQKSRPRCLRIVDVRSIAVPVDLSQVFPFGMTRYHHTAVNY